VTHRILAICVIGLILIIGPTLVWPITDAESATPSPDFSGLWGRNAIDFEPPSSGPGPVVNLSRLPNGTRDINKLVGDYSNPILKPQAAELVKRLGESSRSGVTFPDSYNQCWPDQPPYILRIYEMQILRSKNQITILYLHDHQLRRVRLNQLHPARVTPSWYGDSIGHYEGDTLVIDTVGIKVGPFSVVDQFGTPHTEALHLVERYRLIDGKAAKEIAERNESENGRVPSEGTGVFIDSDYKGEGLQVQFTVEDPGVFTMRWSAKVTYRRVQDRILPEDVCAENTHEYYAGKDTSIPQAEKPDF
jgi:hypothetical protein